mgnify:CR=1 FL=1
MLSNEDNQLVTNIEQGSPMGEVFRRFWLPLMLAEELPTPDCEPVRVTILGEKLIAFYAQNGMSQEELWERLNQSELPKLWIPKREHLYRIDSLPLLGSGKVDLKAIKTMALERTEKPDR